MVSVAISFGRLITQLVLRTSTGETVFDYLQKARLRKACDVLVKTVHTIAGINENCGFCTTSYFIEVFKKRTSMTLLKY